LDDEKDGLSPGPLARGERRATEQEIEKAALREVEEEGGVKARIVKKIGTARWFMGREGLKFVTFYLMEWVKDLPQGFGFETSEIRWLPSEEAKKTISNNREREVLDRADALLASGIQESLV
jgi:8-oxo-dGTP pyrophosphatase MutT (NUDIX family)